MHTPESLLLPPAIGQHLADTELLEVTIGCAADAVYRVLAQGRSARYLKVASGEAGREVGEERDRLVWLRGRLPVPEVLAFVRDGERAYLLLSEVPGLMACGEQFAGDPRALVRLIAIGLRQIHARPIGDCPFDMRLDRRIADAERRLRGGMVDEEDFDECRQGLTAERLFEKVLRERPAEEDLVFTHGDYCLPNVLIDPAGQHVSGYIDWGRAGVADRYADLALAVRSLAYNFGPEVEPHLAAFWDAYGITRPDLANVAYYQLLDEFF